MHVVFNFAYLDPGTGSLIIQSLIGAAAGVAVFGRRMLTGIKMKFSGKKPETSDAVTGTPSTESNKSTE